MAVKQMPIRFNLDNPDEAKAYDYLQRLDKSIYSSYTKAVAAAVINLFDKDESESKEQRVSNTPAVTFSEGCADEIAAAVKKEISNALPELVAATLMQLMQLGGVAANNAAEQQTGTKAKENDNEPIPQLSDSAWSFLDNF